MIKPTALPEADKAFDPEGIDRYVHEYDGMWPAEGGTYVFCDDYDKLLSLYREALEWIYEDCCERGGSISILDIQEALERRLAK